MSDSMDTQALLARLQRHYIKPGAAMAGGSFLPEVGRNGSWGAGNRCDAIYVGYTSTSGRILVGHELKVSRADWLNELKHPGKSDAWADQCHEWYVVVPDPAIVHDGELPTGWGLMTPSRRTKTRMDVKVVPARKPPGHAPSWDAVRSIMARQDTLCREAVLADRQKLREEQDQEVERRIAAATGIEESYRERSARVEERLQILLEALGGWGSVTFDENNRLGSATPEQLSDLVELLRTHRDVTQVKRMLFDGYRDPLSQVDDAVSKLRTALAGLRKVDA
ncbi:hypothetical protein SEA_EYES_58 [Gordonia phage Eyes]|nr:hypothetical protein SEA_EYES_58 [Gordonia phage Eyes]